MKTSWVIGLAMIFIIGTLISGIMELEYLGAGGTQEAVFTQLFTVSTVQGTDPISTIGAVIAVPWQWIQAFWAMLMWDYAFLEGAYSIVKYIIFYPLSIGMIYGIISVFRGNSA